MNRWIQRTLLCFLAATAPPASAQDEPALRSEWLDKDLALIAKVQEFLPPAELSPAAFRARLGSPRVEADESLGLDGRREHLAVYGGYTTLWIRTLIDLSGDAPRYAAIVVECSGSRDSWPLIEAPLKRAWTLEVADVKDEQTLRFEWRDPERVRAIERATAAKLGAQGAVKVPEALIDHYRLLQDPLEFYDFGEVCYYGGVEPLPRSAMNALVAAERWDLVRNVLRGLNPTARVYAADALLRHQPFDRTDLDALRAVRALPLEISTCNGCFVTPQQASELLPPLPK